MAIFIMSKLDILDHFWLLSSLISNLSLSPIETTSWTPLQSPVLPISPTSWGNLLYNSVQFSSVQSLSHARLFVTPWTTARQASLFITNSQGLLKLMSIKSVMPSSHLILGHPLLLLPQSLPASGSFAVSQLFASGGQSTGVSAPALVLPMNTQGWSPLG